ncbi:MAG: hypothetical protein GEU98_25265 [Pseudonocardiaceae bacterium]|nr:hypothetical protein [Pseudonocardiaceae bacterium]
MTAPAIVPPVLAALRRTWTTAAGVERIGYLAGAVLFTSGLVHLGVLIGSGETWEGPLSYRKAATFGLSFGLTLVTVAWASSFIQLRPRNRKVLLGSFTATSIVETPLVTMQVWRGVPSHFNFETGFDNAVSMTLAAGGGVIIVTALGFTAAALRGTGSPGMLLALRFGFVVLLVALGAGALMIAEGVSLARGGQPQLAYTTAGALKPLHAVTMHAILVLPGLAWLLGFTRWTERRQLRVVQLAVAGYALLIAVVAATTV